MSRAEIKELAKQKIKGNKWKIWKPLLIIMVVSSLLSGIAGAIGGKIGTILNLIFSIITTIFSTGYLFYLLKFVRGENLDMSDIIECVKEKWLTIFLTTLLVGIFVALWSILFVIPGIIAAFSYAMATYIVVDSDSEAMDAIKQSKEMMKGHKWEYFVFILSFIGWEMLATLTLGILYIWLFPYMAVATTLFYENLNGRGAQATVEPVAEPNPIQE